MTTDPHVPADNIRQAFSTRHIVLDGRFAALLEADFGIEWATILEALVGEPQKQAIAICTWAEKTNEPAKALLAWSRKHRRGTHRPRRRGCGQHREDRRDGHGRPGGNRTARPDTTTPRRSEEVGSDSLRGVLVDPERLAQTAERLGV